jgi:hypothetical protein
MAHLAGTEATVAAKYGDTPNPATHAWETDPGQQFAAERSLGSLFRSLQLASIVRR